MNVSKLEMQVLQDIANCDMSTDGHGLHGPTADWNFNLPMSQVRALLSTLSQKGIVGVSSAQDMGEDYGWVNVRPEYQSEASESDPALIKGTGYKFINLEVK